MVTLSVIINMTWAQNVTLGVDSNIKLATMIPIVTYNPVNFKDCIISSFVFNKSSDCLFKMRDNGNTSLYWYSDYPDNKGIFTLTKIRSHLPSELQKVLNEKDSVFVFYPNINKYNSSYEFLPMSIKYVGYIEDGELYYINNERRFNSLEQLIIYEFGSLNSFVQKYTDQINEAIYSPISGLYEFEKDELAIQYLNGSYKFYALCKNDDDYKTVIHMFVDWLKTKFLLSINQEKILLSIIYESSKTEKEQMINDFLSGKKILEPFDINCLKQFFSIEEFHIFKMYLREENMKLENSYLFLRNKIPNIDNTGCYYTDSDVLKSLFEKVFQ